MERTGAFRRQSFRRELEMTREQESALQLSSFRGKSSKSAARWKLRNARPFPTPAEDENDMFEERTVGDSSFREQFVAITVKNWNQQRRDPSACLLSMFLPVLFVVGTILLSFAFENGARSAMQFVDYSTYSELESFPALVNINVCYDDSGSGGVIHGLAACSTKQYPHECAGISSGLMRDGFCWNSNTSVFDAEKIVFAFTQQAAAGLAVVPSMSTTILVQWLARAKGLTTYLSATYNTALASISNSGYLYFAPASSETRALIAYMNSTESMFQEVYGGTFNTPSEAEAHVIDRRNEGKNWGIVVVDEISRNTLGVQIRLNHTALPGTSYILDKLYSGGTGKMKNQIYLVSGFASIEQKILDYYGSQVLAISPLAPPPTVVPMPYVAYSDNMFLSGVGQLVPIVIVLGFMYSVSYMTKLMVMEKELRIREAMYIMGIECGPLIVSRYVAYSLQNAATSAISAGLLKATYLKNSDFGVIFFTFFLFSISCISLAGLMSAFFSKSRVAAVLSPLIFLALSMPLFAAGSDGLSSSGLTGLLVVSPSCFTEAVTLLFDHELTRGLGKDQLTDFRDSPDMLLALVMLGVDAIAYLVIMLYVDAVMPNDWGTPRHPFFFVLEPLRYFWPRSRETTTDAARQPKRDGRESTGAFEVRDSSDIVTVRIKGLRKTFTRGDSTLVAVNDLHWKLHESEVSVLLGHNGAGKSTLINIMTGMLPLEEGDCLIYGKSVKHDLRAARREIGFCPQHNILWPELTCAEHLHFYAAIKGLTGSSEREAAVDAILGAVDLAEKKDVPSAMLSGGQKRKLSVAIAFVGGSRLVFLDEPTAGMDVCARRSTWDLIKKLSAGRTILLTTHFMDEADLLGNQIAIMSSGSMKCCGSSVFLKSRLGVGYNITMSVEAHVDAKEIGKAVCSFVPSATPISVGAGEISYRLPLQDVREFPALMEALEEDGVYLGVKSYSLNATTLEEIFLHVAHAAQNNPSNSSAFGSMKTSVGNGTNSTVTSNESKRDGMGYSHFSVYQGPKRNPLDITKRRASSDMTYRSSSGSSRKGSKANTESDTYGPKRFSVDMDASASSLKHTGAKANTESDTYGPKRFSVDTDASGNYRQGVGSPPKANFQVSSPRRTRLVHIDASALTQGSGRAEEVLVNPADDTTLTSGAAKEKNVEDHGVWGVRLETDPTAIFSSQLRSVLLKRLHNVKRDKRTLCLQVVSPVLCILLAMLLTLITNTFSPPIALNSNFYGTDTEIALQNCDGVLFNTSIPFGNSISRFTPLGVTNALNLSNYLLTTAMSHRTERYTSWACADASLAQALGISSATAIFFNGSSIHEVAISLNNYAMQFARYAKKDPFIEFNLIDYPMPKTARETAAQDTFTAIMIGILVMIPFSFIPSTFVSWIVKEKETKARHLQTVSGLGFGVYWIGNFIFDLASFLVSEFLVLAVFGMFTRTEYIGSASVFFATFVLILLYGVSGIGMSYVLSFFFSSHATAQNWVMLANFVCGFFMVMVTMILNFGAGSADQVKIGLTWTFRLVPAFCLGEGIVHLSQRQLAASFGSYVSPWDLSVCGFDMIFMAAETPIFLLFTFLWDRPRTRQHDSPPQHPHDPFDTASSPQLGEDEDVVNERNEIEAFEDNDRKDDLVIVRNLHKVYDNGKVAVRNVSFGVHPGEVFGFLGTNGAGKTTTMSILCQEQRATSGVGLICGKDIGLNSEAALKCIGYCPQFDAVLDLLTVDEHLSLYAGIRGITLSDRPRIVDALTSLCELTNYKKTLACELSGGNRRKLSVALSLVGGPQVVFLDEPSAGMDPIARRGLWTAIQTVAENCAVVLTTHHLEEVEALAHRVTIMVDGTLRCIGNKTHLKNKYGSGFEMSLRIKSADQYDAVIEFVAAAMPLAKLGEYRSLKFTFALPPGTRLSLVFAQIEAEKESLGVTDYSIAQTSIEQVFLEISDAATFTSAET